MNHATDDGYASAVIDTVRALTTKVDGMEQRVEAIMLASELRVEALVTGMRKDVNLSNAGIYVRETSHLRQHSKDRVVHAIGFVLILILLLINLALASYLIGRLT